MVEQASGLRFDIYERVPLNQELNGLEDLEQLELIPNIDVRSEGEQAVLNGSLKLEALLAPMDARSGSTFEHDIPVEITLPMGRIANLDQVGVEIEHFDVDLASPRSLNVTGVLLLKGVEVARSSAEQQWADQEELFVYSSEQQGQDKQGHISNRQDEVLDEEEQQKEAEDELENPPVASNEANAQQAENEFGDLSENIMPEDMEEENEQEETAALQKTEPREPKIAFSSKPAEESQHFDQSMPAQLAPNVYESNVQIDHTQEMQQQTQQQTQEQNQTQETIPATDQLEWKKLFLSRDQEEQPFSRMRMCIVQKEETLEDIASRYEMNPREILLCNRLAESQSVYEGQIIYIPK